MAERRKYVPLALAGAAGITLAIYGSGGHGNGGYVPDNAAPSSSYADYCPPTGISEPALFASGDEQEYFHAKFDRSGGPLGNGPHRGELPWRASLPGNPTVYENPTTQIARFSVGPHRTGTVDFGKQRYSCAPKTNGHR